MVYVSKKKLGSTSNFSCQEGIDHKSWGISWYHEEPSNKRHKARTNQNLQNNPCKPADFRQILQFTSEKTIQLWNLNMMHTELTVNRPTFSWWRLLLREDFLFLVCFLYNSWFRLLWILPLPILTSNAQCCPVQDQNDANIRAWFNGGYVPCPWLPQQQFRYTQWNLCHKNSDMCTNSLQGSIHHQLHRSNALRYTQCYKAHSHIIRIWSYCSSYEPPYYRLGSGH